MKLQYRKHLLSSLVVLLLLLLMSRQALAAQATLSHLTFSDANIEGDTATMSVSGGRETSKTITIENSSEYEIRMEFDYSHYSAGGTGDAGRASTTIASPNKGTCISNENSHCIMTLQSGGSFTITITTWDNFSWLGGTSTYYFKMINIVQSIVSTGTDLTVNYNSDLGTVKHGDTTISAGSTISNIAKDEILTAIANKGTFLGWVDNSGKILSNSATYAVVPTGEAMMVQAVFADAETNAWFLVDNIYLTNNLNTATTLGTSIVLAADGILPAGTYTIPVGDKLLIPYSSTNIFRGVPTEYSLRDMSLDGSGSPPAPEPSIIALDTRLSTVDTEYRRLTMATNTNIIVSGALEVSGQTDSFARGQRGAYGVIQMESSSNITVKNGATLYAYGYVRGNGTVTVESGGIVYEHMDALDYPDAGGGGMDELNKAGVFGMRDFTFNNVEVVTTYQAGAKLKGYIVLTGNMIGTNAFVRDFIGNSTDAVFQLSTGTITKSYVDGRQNITISGAMELNSFSIKISFVIGNYKMDTASTSGLPIGRAFDIVVTDQATVTVNNNIVVYAGGTVTVDQGGKVVIPNSRNIHLLDLTSDPVDNDTVNNYGDIITVNGDAKFDVNGEVEVNGTLYTTYAGSNYASITSSKGTGKITINNVGAATTVAVRQGYKNYSPVSCNITPAKLQNDDTSIVETANGGVNTYTYTDGFWRCATHSGVTSDHTCDLCGYITECIDDNPTDHKCDICGASYLLNIYATNIAVAESLDMYFYIKTDDLVNEIVADKTVGQGYYAIITRAYTGTNEEKKKEIKIPSEDWSVEPHGDVQCVRFCYDNISAKEMTDIISVEIYKSDGIAVSEVYEESVALYAERTLDYYKDESDQTMRTALVNLLKYGEACQDYFDYNETNLATSLLSEEEKNEATQSDPECTNKLKRSDKNPDYFVAASVSAKNRMMYTFYFKNITDQMTATITYTNFAGDSKESTVLGKDFYKYGNWYGVDVTGLSIVDGRQLLTCVVRDSAGNVVTGGTDSVEGYIARAQGLNKPIFGMLMRFVDSAIEYSKVQADTNA